MMKTVSVFCIFRDSESYLDRLFKQLEDLESLSDFKFSYYFYENDSKDNTAILLEKWIKNKSGYFLTEKLNAKKFGRIGNPERMKFLVACRNKCKSLAVSNDTNYSLLIDCDIEFSKENFLIQLDYLNKLDNAVMTTANVRQNIPDLVFNTTTDSYYDTLPFRDKYGNFGLYFSDCPSIKKEDQLDWKIGKPIITCSSFGGFALIYSSIFNKVEWTADIHCDHVNMCYDISRHGTIYCCPRSKVYVEISSSDIHPEHFKNIALEMREQYNFFNS